ncbi:MAG: type VII secretion integral membrane protein EccD [Dermatophilaceae bacterium]
MSQPAVSLAPRRVTVVSPRAHVDLTLPAQAIVADVLQQLSSLVAERRRGAGAVPSLDVSGWALTTLLGRALDDEQTIAQVGVRDGDVLYLRPRRPALPPPLFDDVVDAVALTSGAWHRWDSAATRRTTSVAAAVVVTAGIPALLASGPPWGAVTVVAAVAAAVLFGAAVLLGRVLDREPAALAALVLAIGYAGVCGLVATSEAALGALAGPPQVLLAGVLVVMVAAAGTVALPSSKPLVTFVAVVGGAATVLAGFVVLLDVDAARVAGVGATVVVVFAPSWPTLALRLGQVPMPTVPRDIPDFVELTSADEADDAVAAARSAGQHLTAIVAGFGLVVAGCVMVVLGQDSRWATWLAAVLAVALLTRARHLRSTVPKASALATGAVAALVVAAVVAGRSDRVVVAALVGVCVLTCVVAVVLIERRPLRRPSPHRGRWLDIVEIVALVATVPLLLGVLDLYARLRGIGG